MFDIYVINLKERTDRMENIIKNFGNLFNLIRVDAVKHEFGWKGCFLSHIKCITIAKEKKMKNIFVIEDDCEPYDCNFYDRLCKIKNILDNMENWDIWLGGCNKPNPIEKINISDEWFVKINKARSTHMICYNHTSYDYFLNETMEIPIDCAWYKKINAYTSYPFVGFQTPSFSDISNNWCNCKIFLKLNEKKIHNYIYDTQE
jgi:hypothetical protein